MTDPSANSISSLSSAIAGVVARATPAIVSVHSHRSRASGFVWKPNLVVTADEALADEGEISIELSDGTVRPGRIAGRDHTTDVALLRFDTQGSAKDIVPIKLTPDVPMLGSLSVVVAAERGLPAAALGTVSLVGGRWRSLRGGEIDARVELDVRLRHSHQGGVALNASGDAIGMGEIARACGVSKGTLYVYFADKYRLFEAILEEEQIEQGKTAFNFDPSRDAETTLREFGRAYIAVLCRPGGGSAIRTVMAIAERMQTR